MQSSTFQKPPVLGVSGHERLRPFAYGWKRLARTSGMQQHTEQRSSRSSSKLTVMTFATLQRPPPASLARHRKVPNCAKRLVRARALLQESILDQAPSQTNADGRSQIRVQASALDLVCMQSFYPCLRRRIHVLSGSVQLCKYHAGGGHAVHSICPERGKLQTFISSPEFLTIALVADLQLCVCREAGPP